MNTVWLAKRIQNNKKWNESLSTTKYADDDGKTGNDPNIYFVEKEIYYPFSYKAHIFLHRFWLTWVTWTQWPLGNVALTLNVLFANAL